MSKILILNNLHSLIQLYPSLLISKHLQYLDLYTLPYCLSKNIASDFLSIILHLLSRHLPTIKVLVVSLLCNHFQNENNSL